MDPKLNRMKEEYQNIPVPEELELKVRQSIQNAKKEKSTAVGTHGPRH